MSSSGVPTPPGPAGPPAPAARGCSLGTLGAIGVAFLGLLALLAWVLIQRSGEDDPARLDDPSIIAGDAPEGVAADDQCLLANVLELEVGPVQQGPGETTPMFPRPSTLFDASLTITSTSQAPVHVLVFRSFSAGTPEDTYVTGGRLAPGGTMTEELVAEVFEDGTATYDVVTFAVAYLDTADCAARWGQEQDITAFGTAVEQAPNPLPLAP